MYWCDACDQEIMDEDVFVEGGETFHRRAALGSAQEARHPVYRLASA